MKARTSCNPVSIRGSTALETPRTRLERNRRSRVSICETFTTDAFVRPVPRRVKDTAGSGCQIQVRRDRRRNDSSSPASVETVGLDPRNPLRMPRLKQFERWWLRPPEFSAPCHLSSTVRDRKRRISRFGPGADREAPSPFTASSISETRSPDWWEPRSTTTLPLRSLRNMTMPVAVRLAASKISSGMELAVFVRKE